LENQAQTGLVLVFTHAPLVNLHKDHIIGQEITEHDHECVPKPPNQVTEFLYDWLPYPVEPSSPQQKAEYYRKRGFPQWGVRYFNVGDPQALLDFGCIEGHRNELLSLLTDPQVKKKVAFFSGHTHGIHEFRISRAEETGESQFLFYADNYSGSTGGKRWSLRKVLELLGKQPPIRIPADVSMTSQSLRQTLAEWAPQAGEPSWSGLPAGSRMDALPSHQPDTAAWLEAHSPLLLTSGTLRGRTAPQFREVRVTSTAEGAAILSMPMVSLD
jgi:hypothetical protein